MNSGTKKWVYIFTVILGCIVFSFMLIVVPNLLLPVHEPVESLRYLTVHHPEEEVKDSTNPDASITEAVEQNEELHTEQTDLEDNTETLPPLVEQLASEFRLSPDVDKVPSELQEKAIRWNQAADTFATGAIEILSKAEDMESMEASDALNKLWFAYNNSLRDIIFELPEESWPAGFDSMSYEHSFQNFKRNVWVKQENWGWAAHSSAYMDDWEAEKFYLRKQGGIGHFEIVLRTYERTSNSYKESIWGEGNYKKLMYDF